MRPAGGPDALPLPLTQRMVTGPTIITDATVVVDGPHDLPALEAAARAVCSHHPATRTTVDLDAGRQLVWDAGPETLAVGVPAAPAGALMSTLDRLAVRPIDPATLPVLRIEVVVESDRRMAVHVALPHAVADISSIEVVVRDLVTAYAALCRGERPVLPPARPFADVLAHRRDVLGDDATWTPGGAGARAAAFWAERLAGSVPPGFARPGPEGAADGGRMATLREHLGGDVRQRLDDVCARERCSLFHLSLAAFEEAVAAETGEPDVTTASILHGRETPGFENTVGVLITDVAFRRESAGGDRRAHVAAVATDAWLTHLHQRVRLLELADRVPEVAAFYARRRFRNLFLQFRPQRVGRGLEGAVVGARLSFPPGPRAMLGCSWPGIALLSVDDLGGDLAVELLFDRRRWAATQMRRLHSGVVTGLAGLAAELGDPARAAAAADR